MKVIVAIAAVSVVIAATVVVVVIPVAIVKVAVAIVVLALAVSAVIRPSRRFRCCLAQGGVGFVLAIYGWMLRE